MILWKGGVSSLKFRFMISYIFEGYINKLPTLKIQVMLKDG